MPFAHCLYIAAHWEAATSFRVSVIVAPGFMLRCFPDVDR